MVLPFLKLVNRYYNNCFFVGLYSLTYFIENIFFQCSSVNRLFVDLKKLFVKKFLSFCLISVFNFLTTGYKYKLKRIQNRKLLRSLSKSNLKINLKNKLKLKKKLHMPVRLNALKQKILKSLKSALCFIEFDAITRVFIFKNIFLR